MSATDDPEGFVAHIALSILYCHLHMMEIAQAHIARAAEIIKHFSDHKQTVRGSGMMRVVRVNVSAEEITETLVLPMIGTKLYTPSVGFEAFTPTMRVRLSHLPTAHVRDIEVARVILRLRTTRSAGALGRLGETQSSEECAAALTNILDECTSPAQKKSPPLEMADDYFSLARELARLGQHSLVGLALEKAKCYTKLYADSTDIKAHRLRSDTITQKVTGLIADLIASIS